MEFLFGIIGLVLGALAAGLYLQRKAIASAEALKLQVSQLQSSVQILDNQKQDALQDAAEAKAALEENRQQVLRLTADFNREQTEHKNLQERLARETAELEKREEQLRERFENLANEILDKKSEKFTNQNKENLSELLNPLRERIMEFQERVDKTHLEGEKRGAALVEQIKNLKELNQVITQEAKSLTLALRGESKTQGNWGELQLESILEKAGLQKDIHYFKEKNFKTEDGSNQRLDYIVNLPDGKHLILDSKVSLSAYSRYFDTDDEAAQQRALKEHIASIYAHIKNLGDRNYQSLYGITAPDYVMMFIANEPALTIALKEDPQLYERALEKNIALVSTTTLLATLRTIAYIWKQDQQNKNADEIARQAGALYDKFVSFTEDLTKLGTQLGTVQKTYQESMKKLTDGTGNLIRRTEKLKELGANPSKNIDPRLLDRSK